MRRLVYAEDPGTYEVNMAQKIQELYVMKEMNMHFGREDYIENQDSTLRKRITRIRNSVTNALYHPQDIPTDPNQWNQLAHDPKNKRKKRLGNKQQ